MCVCVVDLCISVSSIWVSTHGVVLLSVYIQSTHVGLRLVFPTTSSVHTQHVTIPHVPHLHRVLLQQHW